MLEVRKMSPTPPMSSVWAKGPQVKWSQPLCRKVQLRSRPTKLVQELETEELLQIKVEKKREKVAS